MTKVNYLFEQEYADRCYTSSLDQVLVANDGSTWRLAITNNGNCAITNTDPKCDIDIKDDIYSDMLKATPQYLSVDNRLVHMYDEASNITDPHNFGQSVGSTQITAVDQRTTDYSRITDLEHTVEALRIKVATLENSVKNNVEGLKHVGVGVEDLIHASKDIINSIKNDKIHDDIVTEVDALGNTLINYIDQYFKQEVAKYLDASRQWANLDQHNRPSANESLNNAADQTSKHLTNGFNLKG
tara:strand:- start:324 stop:1049 length:726 start_codon:yes stop_codon:yes gene_type:complete